MNASKQHAKNQTSVTIDDLEVEKFSSMAANWWDPEGPMAPLHRLNPVRLAYIHEQAVSHFGLDASVLKPLKGKRALDVGCGGGLVTEALARMGAQTTGLDASAEAIDAAKAHAQSADLMIDYRVEPVDQFAKAGHQYDLITALEVVEHVADVPVFLTALAQLLAPGGLLVFSTPNRTPQSYLSVIVGAERLLRWLPKGTHDWDSFLTPEELTSKLNDAGLHVANLQGLSYSLLGKAFRLTNDLSVNYIGTAKHYSA